MAMRYPAKPYMKIETRAAEMAEANHFHFPCMRKMGDRAAKIIAPYSIPMATAEAM